MQNWQLLKETLIVGNSCTTHVSFASIYHRLIEHGHSWSDQFSLVNLNSHFLQLRLRIGGYRERKQNLVWILRGGLDLEGVWRIAHLSSIRQINLFCHRRLSRLTQKEAALSSLSSIHRNPGRVWTRSDHRIIGCRSELIHELLLLLLLLPRLLELLSQHCSLSARGHIWRLLWVLGVWGVERTRWSSYLVENCLFSHRKFLALTPRRNAVSRVVRIQIKVGTQTQWWLHFYLWLHKVKLRVWTLNLLQTGHGSVVVGCARQAWMRQLTHRSRLFVLLGVFSDYRTGRGRFSFDQSRLCRCLFVFAIARVYLRFCGVFLNLRLFLLFLHFFGFYLFCVLCHSFPRLVCPRSRFPHICGSILHFDIEFGVCPGSLLGVD